MIQPYRNHIVCKYTDIQLSLCDIDCSKFVILYHDEGCNHAETITEINEKKTFPPFQALVNSIISYAAKSVATAKTRSGGRWWIFR